MQFTNDPQYAVLTNVKCVMNMMKFTWTFGGFQIMWNCINALASVIVIELIRRHLRRFKDASIWAIHLTDFNRLWNSYEWLRWCWCVKFAALFYFDSLQMNKVLNSLVLTYKGSYSVCDCFQFHCRLYRCSYAQLPCLTELTLIRDCNLVRYWISNEFYPNSP